MALIGISGKIGAGKDTFANLITNEDSSYQLKSFAYKLKYMTAYLTGQKFEDMFTQEGKNIYLEEWGMTVGEFQQKLGTEGIRNGVHYNGWILALFADYTGEENWIITDVRFKNEAQSVIDREGILVRIEGDPAGVRANSKRDMTHISETDLDDWEKWDFRFDNEPGMLDSGILQNLAWEVLDLANNKLDARLNT